MAGYFGGSFFVPFYISSVLCGIAAVFSFIFILRPLIRGRIAKETPRAIVMSGNELVQAAPASAESTERILAGTGRGR